MPDLKAMARRLAADERLSDYHFWRWLKDIDDALYQADRRRQPIPFHLIYARRLLRNARLRRRRND
jgi:hypothetical protein